MSVAALAQDWYVWAATVRAGSIEQSSRLVSRNWTKALRFQAIQDKYISKEPEDDEDLLANMLAARVIAITQKNDKVSSELEKMIRKWVHEMPPEAARRAAVTAKERAEEWLNEIAEMEEGM